MIDEKSVAEWPSLRELPAAALARKIHANVYVGHIKKMLDLVEQQSHDDVALAMLAQVHEIVTRHLIERMEENDT